MKINLIDKFSARSYQQSIFANSLNKNTLVVLPTGLGKTVIALMLVTYYFNQSGKKILFLAPTKPLVEQQKQSFQNFFKNESEFIFTTLTGQIQPKKRIELYERSNFIFSTPQLIENDIINNVINLKDFCLIVFDEAHRATGAYAYNFIAEEFTKNSNTKILALTASPGTSMEDIKNVIDNLKIEHVEVKKYDDVDVKPYVQETKINYINIAFPENFKEIKYKLDIVYNGRILALKEFGFLQGKNLKTVTKRDLLDLSIELRKEIAEGNATEEIWKSVSVSAGLMKLQYGIELFESQEISAAHNYFYNFFRDGGDSSKAAQELAADIDFRNAFELISKLKKNNVKHPKLLKLKEIVTENLNKNKELKIIVFNQYRDTATKIVEELNTIKEVSVKRYKNESKTVVSRIKAVLFVGQAKKTEKGLSQKQQKQIIEDFKDNKYNILVSTSVGEEGLDIPKVDLVIFYEPVPSAIRTIQRAGRTGRFKKGEVNILVSENTKDTITRHIATAKEKRMYKVLDKIRDEFSSLEKDQGLTKFISNKKEDTEVEIKTKDVRYPIIVDSRENSDLIKQLYKQEDIRVEAKKLDVADIVITEHIAIERKAKEDFVNSILNKRIFSQLIDLAKNYKRPLLILEGKQNIYTLRNLNPNVIRATISAISIDFRIPIIQTDSIEETVEMIKTITKRANKERKVISPVANKTSSSENEELEKFVATIPKINIMTAKELLGEFGTIKKLVNTKDDKLIKISGIGKLRAKSLIEFFNKEYE